MGFLSRTSACPDGGGSETAVTSPIIQEAQGFLRCIPQQDGWVAEEVGLLLTAQAPTCPVCEGCGKFLLLEHRSCFRIICGADGIPRFDQILLGSLMLGSVAVYKIK